MEKSPSTCPAGSIRCTIFDSYFANLGTIEMAGYIEKIECCQEDDTLFIEKLTLFPSVFSKNKKTIYLHHKVPSPFMTSPRTFLTDMFNPITFICRNFDKNAHELIKRKSGEDDLQQTENYLKQYLTLAYIEFECSKSKESTQGPEGGAYTIDRCKLLRTNF